VAVGRGAPGLADGTRDGLHVHAQPACEPARVLRAQRAVLDPGDDGGGGAQRLDPALGGVEVDLRERRADRELEERLAGVDEPPDGVRAVGLAELARVHPVLGDGDEGLRDEPLVVVERAQRRLAPGLVPVEREDHLAAEDAALAEAPVVAEEPAQDPSVIGPEGGATGGHGGLDTGQVAGHDVGVALDDHGPALAGDLPLGEVDAVEHLRLLVDRGLRRVEVLGLDAVVVEQAAGAEADDVRCDVPDRPDQPSPEPVVDASLAAGGDSARDEVVLGEAPAPQVTHERITGARRETDAEPVRRVAVEAAVREEPARGDGVPGGRELFGVELGGQPVGLDEPLPLPDLLPAGAAAPVLVLVVQLVAEAGREQLH
jgi:hypothetical protein